MQLSDEETVKRFHAGNELGCLVDNSKSVLELVADSLESSMEQGAVYAAISILERASELVGVIQINYGDGLGAEKALAK